MINNGSSRKKYNMHYFILSNKKMVYLVNSKGILNAIDMCNFYCVTFNTPHRMNLKY